MQKRTATHGMLKSAAGWSVIAVVVLVLAPGCATMATDGSDRGSREVLTREQLESVGYLSAFDAVRRLRPTWLQTERGQDSFVTQSRRGLRVYLDNIQLGGPETLQSLQVKDIQEIRFLDKRKATTEFGTDHAEGALLVITRSS